MSLRKSATREAPHAVFTYGDWTWSVLRVNAPAKGLFAPWATWFCLVVTPMTGAGGDMGDTYITDVLSYGILQSSTDEFRAYFEKGK